MWISYLINLAENKERLQNCARQFEAQNIPFTRIEAVNGRALPQEAIDKLYDPIQNKRKAKHDLVPAEIGCYASHIEAWRAIAAGKDDGGFILEDDFAADERLGSILNALVESPLDWDIVKLFAFDENPKAVQQAQLTDHHKLIVPQKVPSCTLGYAITRRAAEHLLNVSLPFYRPIDEDHKFFWEKDIDVRLVTPPPLKVGDQQTETGTIGFHRKQAGKLENKFSLNALTQAWRKWRYQFGYQSALKSARNKAQ